MLQHAQEPPVSKELLLDRTRDLYAYQQENIYQRTDRLFAWLMAFQWVACVITSLWISPRAWEGTVSSVHLHVWAALIVGGAISAFPIALAILRPGKAFTRHVIAASQMLMSALLIHLTGGRIETHFHVFGSLAFLAFYRDWKVLVTASLVVALDHAVRGLFFPYSVYGVWRVEPWRWLEHTGWVLFEDAFLFISIKQSLKAVWDVAFRQSELEQINQSIEAKVVERTAELQVEIAERKQAEAELESINTRLQHLSKDLERSRDQAVQASRFKSEFLANMSHEIRTPLNAVVGMSDLLMRTPLSDEQREFGMIINGSADILLNIVNDILDYSKIESGRLDIEIIDFDLVEMVEGAAELVADKARGKNLALTAFIDPQIPRTVRGDPSRIRQILLNFLSNSIKFTDRGEIVIRAMREYSSDENELVICFSVSDTGIGLNDSAKERLFQPFTQADASITRKYGGTGLGLAISKRLVELMGGDIEFESVYGEGTVFKFSVPLDKGAQQPAPYAIPPDDVQKSRILIIDGPAGTQQVLNCYIASWGLRCSVATDVDKAVVMMRREAAANDPYDIAIVGLEPGKSEFSKLLRELQSYQLAATKLIVIGSSVDRQIGKRLLDEGFSAYLPLPVRQSRLFDCIVNLLHATTDLPSAINFESDSSEKVLEREARNLILVVEDNAINQKVALLQLRELGLAAHAVGNGREALEAVARTQYALILMDCQMPEMDGLQATKEIRKLEALTGKHSPVIAMTAHAMSSDRMECLAAGMDDYISKPVNQKKLAEVLDRWLPRSTAAAEGTTAGAVGLPNSTGKPVELEVLRSTFGEPLVKELLREFIIDAEKQFAKLTSALSEKDVSVLKASVHDLKGESATLYATEVADLSRSFEEHLDKKDFSWDQVESRLNALKQAWTRTKSYLQEAGYCEETVHREDAE